MRITIPITTDSAGNAETMARITNGNLQVSGELDSIHYVKADRDGFANKSGTFTLTVRN